MRKLDYRVRHRLENACIYTILKYLDKCDFSKIANVNALAFRYLGCNLIALKKDFDERKKRNVK